MSHLPGNRDVHVTADVVEIRTPPRQSEADLVIRNVRDALGKGAILMWSLVALGGLFFFNEPFQDLVFWLISAFFCVLSLGDFCIPPPS